MGIINILDLLISLASSEIECSESWGFLNLKDLVRIGSLKKIKDIEDYFIANSSKGILSVRLDGSLIEEGDLKSYIENNIDFQGFELSINKNALLSSNSSEYSENFFFSCSEFEKWMSGLSAFDPNNPFHSKIRVIVNGLDNYIVGKRFQIIPLRNSEIIQEFTLGEGIPEMGAIGKVVHSFTDQGTVINPLSFIYQTNSKHSVKETFTKLACMTLSASIVNEFYSESKITVDGIRRMNLRLYKNEKLPSSLYDNLLKLVKWMYEEKTATRQKLFNDRITLEINEDKSYIFSLGYFLETSLEQAKQRYNFVILERKDKYVSELKDLLKDIRGQSDLYSQKIRSLLNNLLRDVLAALLLVGFTLFTKFSDNLQLDKELLLSFVFYALAVYYLVSIFLQAIVDITDIQVSKNEMFYWKKTTKELIPEEDFKKNISESLRGRRVSLRVIYPIIVLLYIGVAISCYIFPEYFHQISKSKKEENKSENSQYKETNDKVSKYKTSRDSSSFRRK